MEPRQIRNPVTFPDCALTSVKFVVETQAIPLLLYNQISPFSLKYRNTATVNFTNFSNMFAPDMRIPRAIHIKFSEFMGKAMALSFA